MSMPARSSASARGSPGPGITGRIAGSPWNRRRSAGSVISAVLNPVSSSSHPPSHSSSTPGTGTRTSSADAPCSRTYAGRSIEAKRQRHDATHSGHGRKRTGAESREPAAADRAVPCLRRVRKSGACGTSSSARARSAARSAGAWPSPGMRSCWSRAGRTWRRCAVTGSGCAPRSGTDTVQVHAIGGPGEIGLRPGDVLVVATKSQDSVAVLSEWAGQPVAGGGTASQRPPGHLRAERGRERALRPAPVPARLRDVRVAARDARRAGRGGRARPAARRACCGSAGTRPGPTRRSSGSRPTWPAAGSSRR